MSDHVPVLPSVVLRWSRTSAAQESLYAGRHGSSRAVLVPGGGRGRPLRASRCAAVPASAGRHPACAAAGERTRHPPAAPPPVTPTPAGKRLARHARTLLAAANAALDEVAEAARHEPTAPRPLPVGIMGHGSAELTPAAINAYRRARPDVPSSRSSWNSPSTSAHSSSTTWTSPSYAPPPTMSGSPATA